MSGKRNRPPQTKPKASLLPARDDASLREEADSLIGMIAADSQDLNRIRDDIETAMRRAALPFQNELNATVERVNLHEARLRQLALDYRPQFFPGAADKLDLENGVLLLQVTRPLAKVKDIVARLWNSGLAGLLKVSVTADWDGLDALPADEARPRAERKNRYLVGAA
jgi:hypothetical protein